MLKKIKTVWSQGDAGKETMLQRQKSALEGILCLYLFFNETLDEEKVEPVLKKIKTVWSRGDAGASRGRGGAYDQSLGENLIALLGI